MVVGYECCSGGDDECCGGGVVDRGVSVWVWIDRGGAVVDGGGVEGRWLKG